MLYCPNTRTAHCKRGLRRRAIFCLAFALLDSSLEIKEYRKALVKIQTQCAQITLPLTLNSVTTGVKWLCWAQACPQKCVLGSQQCHENYMGTSKGRIWPTIFNYLKFQGYLQNMGRSPIKAKQSEEKDIPE